MAKVVLKPVRQTLIFIMGLAHVLVWSFWLFGLVFLWTTACERAVVCQYEALACGAQKQSKPLILCF